MDDILPVESAKTAAGNSPAPPKRVEYHRLLRSAFARDLAVACAAGDINQVTALLNGENPDGVTLESDIGWEGTPLMIAAASGHLELCRLLLARGAQVSAALANGSTALHNAACAGDYTISRLLLDQGADVHGVAYGMTPLDGAIKSGCLPLIQELYQRGAGAGENEEDRDARVFTALHRGFWPVARWIMEMGAVKAGRTRYGKTLLSAAVEGGAGREQIAWLLERGEDIQAIGLPDNRTALHTAASSGNGEAAQILLERGADREARDEQGYTPLHLAARGGHADTLRLLLRAGANREAQDRSGHTPLFNAAETGQTEAIQILLDAGANIEAHASDGVTPLLRATGFASYPARQDALTDAARLLLERKADPNVVSRRGVTPLLAALQNRQLSLIPLLLQCGADVARAETAAKISLLPLAAPWHSIEPARLLLDAGAAVDGRDRLDKTALMIATYYNDKPLMALLLERGADPNAVTKKGKSVLDFAVKGKRERVTLVRLLKEAGAKPNTAQTPA